MVQEALQTAFAIILAVAGAAMFNESLKPAQATETGFETLLNAFMFVIGMIVVAGSFLIIVVRLVQVLDYFF